jgi:hypothetical protein
MSDIVKDDMGGAANTAVNPSSTPNPSIPGVGIKYPTRLTAARRNKGYTMKARKAGKVREAQTGADGMSAQGAISSGGAGGSLGY